MLLSVKNCSSYNSTVVILKMQHVLCQSWN